METVVSGEHRPIHVFWHVYVDHRRVTHCTHIIQRQFAKLQASGLLDQAECVHIGYVSSVPFPCKEVLGHPKIHIAAHQQNGYEGVTTRYLKSICDNLDSDIAVLYIHTRGTTRRADTPAEDWTLMMEHFVIDRWRHALRMLHGCHTCGCEMWRHRHRVLKGEHSYHYSGNFWWAKSEYIKLLPPPTSETRHMESEDWVLQLAGRRFDKNEFGVLHRTAAAKYERGLINSYVHRYPAAYYRSGKEVPDEDLAPLLRPDALAHTRS
jgi:hypothetical protein